MNIGDVMERSLTSAHCNLGGWFNLKRYRIMSNMEAHIGKLRKVATGVVNSVAYIVQSKEKLTDWRDNEVCLNPEITTEEGLVDFIGDIKRRKYYYHKGSLYELDDKGLNADEDIFESTLEDDGTISYVVNFYNGGAGFEEVLEEILDKHVK